MAEKELARKQELEETLDYMCQQLGQLQIVCRLPREIEGLQSIINRAMDVRSAFMVYLAMHIHHEATPGGTLGSHAQLLH